MRDATRYCGNGSEVLSVPESFVDPAWSLQQGIDLCTAIHNLPAQQFNCHPALTGGLLYKTGPRKDCDIVIYQRGDVGGKREPIDWGGLWAALRGIGLCLINDFGYVKKCTYHGKVVDIFDPTQEGGNYGQGDESAANEPLPMPAPPIEEPENDIVF
jgi:hypothetical protein